MATLCRDCTHIATDEARACPRCSGRRLIRHDGLESLSIAHIDCDAFFAAIEKRDDPSLVSRPVIVGGGTRGVVATCCYIARLSGVRSAMPMFKALKACPDAVVIRPNFEKYSAAGRAIREKMEALTPLVQPVSIDEAYLDLSGTRALHGAAPAALLARLAREVEADIGITISVGLSGNKFLAKTASELDKPRGFAVIDPAEAPALLAPRPIGFLHGVGPKLAARLERDGYASVGDLQAAGLKALLKAYGETGQYLFERAHGRDNRPVIADSERKSVSSETTFNEDISALETLVDRLWEVCEKTARRAKAAGVDGRVVTLKLRTARFQTLTRRVSLPEGTQLARTLFDVCQPLLAREAKGTAFRLIGVGLSELTPERSDSVDLIDPRIAKRAAAERAVDSARSKFGEGSVQSARALRSKRD